MEPCGCVLDFPMPTLAQDHAAAELTAIERARASTPAWSYAIGAGAGTVIAVLAAFALVAFGLRLPWGLAQTWNVTALLSALMATAVWGRQWWFQRAHESASRRLTATSGNEQGEPL
jgi:high-affinity Fe2+/Pb2+ permease